MRSICDTAIIRMIVLLLLLLSSCLGPRAWWVIGEAQLVQAEGHMTELPAPLGMLGAPEPPDPTPEPDFVGLATWYGGEHHIGRQTRSGEPYDPDAAACAVPNELWPELEGKILHIQSVDDSTYVLVRVNDSGHLSEAGRFTWDVRRVGEYDVARWWPDDDGLPVVVDLTPSIHKQLSPSGQTVQVHVWIAESGL